MHGKLRLWMCLWLLGHAGRARADTRLRFSPSVLAASGAWMAAAAVDGEDRVRVLRSADGGRSWQELPSPRDGEICGLALSLAADGGLEVSGSDDACSGAPWSYRWSPRDARWQDDGPRLTGLTAPFAVEHGADGPGRPRQDAAARRRR